MCVSILSGTELRVNRVCFQRGLQYCDFCCIFVLTDNAMFTGDGWLAFVSRFFSTSSLCPRLRELAWRPSFCRKRTGRTTWTYPTSSQKEWKCILWKTTHRFISLPSTKSNSTCRLFQVFKHFERGTWEVMWICVFNVTSCKTVSDRITHRL